MSRVYMTCTGDLDTYQLGPSTAIMSQSISCWMPLANVLATLLWQSQKSVQAGLDVWVMLEIDSTIFHALSCSFVLQEGKA